MPNSATTQPRTDNIQAEIADLRNQMAAIGDALSDDAEDTGRTAWSRLRTAGRDAGSRARAAGLAARDQAAQTTEATRGQISRAPLASVGIAFAVGVTLGALIGRR
jgi:ElaB/YqjD/DUF883 family membrane-anchored ribosome-binding protein